MLKLTLTRSTSEIVARVEASKDTASRMLLVSMLPFEEAIPWLNKGMTEREWGPVMADPVDIMRTIVASFRQAVSVTERHDAGLAKVGACWLNELCWLLGDDDNVVITAPFDRFGAPGLAAALQFIGGELEGDIGWLERMMQGLPCSDTCVQGCLS